MMTSFLPKLTFVLATTLSTLAGCTATGSATSSTESEIGANLVSTTYYDCKTGQLVGEKTQGCVVGPGAQWGRTTSCYEVDSDTCDTAEPIEIVYCAFDNACDAFEFPDAPEVPYTDWLASHQ